MKALYVLALLTLFSCSGSKSISSCNENMRFKKEFFKQIQNIEDAYKEDESTLINKDYEALSKKDEEFWDSLQFIMNYTYVSRETMDSYVWSYPEEIFLKGKKGWLKWYEENRCNNIQFK